MGDFWVFGYGSLMWNPGFAYDEMVQGRLYGYHRSLCIYSHHYRGTPAHPGLVLGLDRGGCCEGMAFHIPENYAQTTFDYLVEREQVNGVYLEKRGAVHLCDKRIVNSLFFVADRAHSQYAGKLVPETMAAIVNESCGLAGPNRDYVTNTIDLLRNVGIRDNILERLEKLLPDGR